MRAVASLCVRGLAHGLTSLSFGKIVLGAAMVWMAVAFISTGGHNSTQTDSTSAHGDNTATVELASYSDQGSDGTNNNSGFSVPRWGMGHTQPASSSAIPESSTNQNGHQFAPNPDSDITTVGPLSVKAADSGEGADSKETSHAVEAPQLEPRRTGSLADLLTGLFGRLAQATGGDTSSTGSGGNTSGSATSTNGGSSGGGTVSTQSSTQQGGQTAQAARDTATTTRSDANAATSAKTTTDPQPNRQPSKVTCGLCGRAPPVQPAPPPHRVTCGLCGAPGPQPTPPSRSRQLDQFMGGFVDLVSGIVSGVAGKPAGDRARQGLSQITGEVSDALDQAAQLNQTSGANGAGGTPATTPQSGMTSRVSKQTDKPDPGPGLTGGNDPNQPGCTSSTGCTDDQQALTGRLPSATPARGPPANALNPQQNQNLNTGQGSASAKITGASQTTLDTTQLHKIFGQARRFTRDLIDIVTKHGSVRVGHQDGQPSTNTGSTGSQSSGQSSLTDQINQATNNFLTDLFNLLGINPQNSQSGTNAGSGGTAGSGSTGQGATGQVIGGCVVGACRVQPLPRPTAPSTAQPTTTQPVDKLVNNFVTELLNLLGIGGQRGNQSSGQNGVINTNDQLTRGAR